MEERNLARIAIGKLIEIFGKQYLRDNYVGSCTSYGMLDDKTFLFFLGIKTSSDLPDRKANDHGWVIYGKVLVNASTGEIKNIDYQK